MKCATHGLKDPRDGRELSIVEPHVNISASFSFERRGFLVQKRMGGAPANSRNVAELSGRRTPIAIGYPHTEAAVRRLKRRRRPRHLPLRRMLTSPYCCLQRICSSGLYAPWTTGEFCFSRAAQAADAGEDETFGQDKRGDEMPDWAGDKQKRLAKIQQAMAALEAEARLAACTF
jgi:hypothetical protein